MEWGEHEQFLKDLAAENRNTGAPPPAVLQRRPVLAAGLEDYLGAFWALNPERLAGNGDIGVIPIAAIDIWCRHYADPGEFDLFFRLIRKLDQAYVAHVRAKRPSSEG